MARKIDARLDGLGIKLPPVQAPAFNYVPIVRTGNLLFVSGQLPWVDGRIEHTGRLGAEVAIERGQEAARLCALNMLAQVREACGGDLDRVTQCVKIGGFVSSTPDFFDHPKVVNAASDLMIEVFGESGRHARFAVGSSALPRNVAVELEGVFEVR